MRELLELYKLEAEELHEYVKIQLEQYGYSITEVKGDYLYAVDQSFSPVLLVSHMDTVHKNKPTNKTLKVYNDIITSPTTGLGADDRNGVFAILKILESGKRPQVLFTHEEEVGGLGAKAFVKDFKNPIISTKFMIELDRKGINDCVFYDCGNDKFKALIASYGFVSAYGSYTDIVTIGKAWDVASVNLSIGYYGQHTKAEYTLFSGIEFTIGRVISILEDSEQMKAYDYQEKTYIYTNRYNSYKPSKPKYVKGDMVKCISKDKWCALEFGKVYEVSTVMTWGVYLVNEVEDKTLYARNEQVEIYVEPVVEDNTIQEDIDNARLDMESYLFTMVYNKKVAEALQDEFDVWYDKDMNCYFVEPKDEEETDEVVVEVIE